MDISAVADLSFGQFFVAVVFAAALSMLVYWHASKHGSRHATLWGVLTFLLAVVFLPLYFLQYFLTRRRF